MKIICSQESLLHGIQIVQKGISPKIGLPIYNGILFEVGMNNKLHLFATDLEIGIDCNVPAQIIESGSVVIPNRIISDLIRKFPKGNIEIESLEKNNIIIRENNAIYKILGFSSEEFSNFPEIKLKYKIKIKQKIFKEAINQTIFASSKDEGISFLNGILLKIIDNKMEIVATDSHRLSYKKIEELIIEKKSSENFEVIIPYRALAELYKLLSEEEKLFEIWIEDQQIMFILEGMNNIRFYSRLIEGKFPDYQQIIPNSFNTEIRLNNEEFRDKIERISLFGREELNTVKIEVSNKNLEKEIEERSEMLIKAENPTIGEALEKLACFKKGENVNISFNSKYILEAVKVINSENIMLKINENFSPAIITPEDEKNYLHIVMPMRSE
ncbi:MAG: DNA polymerase III subunit beta [Candidatus Caldatribacteriota bacterium]